MKIEEAKRIAMGLRTDFKCESDTMVDFCNTIIKALEQERSKSAEITQYKHDCEKLMEENERLKKALEQQPCEDWCDVPSYEMTLEQARQAVRDLRKFVMDNHILPKLQPCEDAISRKAVLDELNRLGRNAFKDDTDYDNFFAFLDSLPPIQPKAKVGHWIMKHRTHNEMKHYTGQDEMGETHTISVFESYEVDEPYCSECGKLAGDTSQNYCCVCGAEMQEVKE